MIDPRLQAKIPPPLDGRNYTSAEVDTIINVILDMAADVLHTIATKQLWHPDLDENEVNTSLISGQVSFAYDVKNNKTDVVCPFHNTRSMDSTYVYHRGTHGNKITCKGNCPMNGRYYSNLHVWMHFVKGVPIKFLFTKSANTRRAYRESKKELAALAGITHWTYETRVRTEEEQQAETVHKMLQTAASFYHREFLKRSKNDKIVQRAWKFAMHERNLSLGGTEEEFLDFAKTHQLGVAPGKYGSKRLYAYLSKIGYTDDQMLAAGLVMYKKVKRIENGKPVLDEKGKAIYDQTDQLIDFLTERLTFPYYNEDGQVFSIYGRRIEFKEELAQLYKSMTPEQIKNQKRGKHLRLNLPMEEPVNFADAQRYERIIVVEGEIDYLTFRRLGFKNVMAVGGTSGLLSKIELLTYTREMSNRAYCHGIDLCFDEDSAGQKAMMELGDLLIKEGFDVRVMRLTDGDPNDYAVKYSAQAEALLRKAEADALCYDGFAVLRLLKGMAIRTYGDVQSFALKVKNHIAATDPLQRLAIAGEVIEGLNQSLPPERRLELRWLLHAWGIVPDPSLAPAAKAPQLEGFDQAAAFAWMLITNSKDRFLALSRRGMKQVVFASDLLQFAARLKTVPNVRELVIDSAIDEAKRAELIRHLPKGVSSSLRSFEAPTVQSISKASADTLRSFVVPYSPPIPRG